MKTKKVKNDKHNYKIKNIFRFRLIIFKMIFIYFFLNYFLVLESPPPDPSLRAVAPKRFRVVAPFYNQNFSMAPYSK